jgi:serine/threonine protein kinase
MGNVMTNCCNKYDSALSSKGISPRMKNKSAEYSYMHSQPNITLEGKTSESGVGSILEWTSDENIRNFYQFGKIIGTGKFGTVCQAQSIAEPNRQLAIKTIPKATLKGEEFIFKRELDILREVDHPNIIKIYESFMDKKYYHIVMQYCDGGELFERIIEKTKFTEGDAIKVIKQVLQALKYLHDKGICHRDLKPENIVYENRSDESSIKIIDFGLANYFHGANKLYTMVGTTHYMAPEVFHGDYGIPCDIWSLGVITFTLLGGYPPFYEDNDARTIKKI